MSCLASIGIIILPLFSRLTDRKKTTEQVELYYTSPQVKSSAFNDMRAINSAMWHTVFTEDIRVVEGMQKGRHAPAYDGGKFSAVMDGPTYHFHKWVAHQLFLPA